MILLDAIYINNSGGKILLDYLIESLEATNKKVTYLLDDRVKGNHPKIDYQQEIIYLQPSLWQRHRFYKKCGAKFSTVLCFGNLPPTVRLNAKVITYLHQKQYVQIPADLPLKNRLILRLKAFVFKNLLRYTNTWAVQSPLMKEEFCRKFGIPDNRVEVLPFYPPLRAEKEVPRKKNTFCYISSGAAHKNHARLLDGFKYFYDKTKVGALTLTVGNTNPPLQKKIQELSAQGYPIQDVGQVERKKIAAIYAGAHYLIYPSLAESFGLGLIEAIENGCQVIGADLPYTYAVCDPSLTFSPENVQSMVDAFTIAISSKLPPTIARISNEIGSLLNLLV